MKLLRVVCLAVCVSWACVQGATMAGEAKTGRWKRSALSLPPLTTLRVALDAFVPVVPLLDSTFTIMQFNYPVMLTVPGYKEMKDLYASLGRAYENGLDDDVDIGFVDAQRANQDRRAVYGVLKGFFDSIGFDGQSCVERAICELSEAPLGHNGLFGKVVHLLLPTTLSAPPSLANATLAELVDADQPLAKLLREPVHDRYTRASEAGQRGKCAVEYAKCPISVFKMLNL